MSGGLDGSAFEVVIAVTDCDPVCWRCQRHLGAYFSRPWSLRCRRCGAQNRSAGDHPADLPQTTLLTNEGNAG